MSHAARRPLLTAAVAATSLALGASGAQAAQKVSKPEKAQNTAIKKAQKTATNAGKSAKSASKDAKKALKDAATGIANAKTADGKAAAAQNGLNVIFGQVPAVLDGLTKLASGLTAAGDGLTKLGNAVAAQEYGVVKAQLGGNDVPGAILTSSDIPDDGNAATLSGTLLVPIPPGLVSPTPITLLAGVRSGEADGTGPSDPVASAGIVTMTAAGSPGLTIDGGNAPLPPTVPITSKANDAADGAPVYPIPFKAPRVDATPNPFSFPTDKAIDLTDPATLQDFTGLGAGPFTVANSTGVTGIATITFTVRFNDLTASATDVTA